MNKTTFEVRRSIHTPDYDTKEWWNSFNNPIPKLPIGFDYNPRNWKTIDDKIVETTEEEKGKWDDEHPVPEPIPTIEERLALVEQEISTVKNDVSALKTAKG
jgi:hypothetical protein